MVNQYVLSMNKVKHYPISLLVVLLIVFFFSFSAQAQKLFQRKIHVTDSVILAINATALTPDGGVLVGANELLLKVASDGTIEWVKRLRTDSANFIAIAGISVDSTGDIIFTGRWFVNAQDIFFGRCSSEGILKWYKVYDLGGRDEPEFQLPLSDGSFLVGGETMGDSEKTFLVKFNADGDIQWTTALVSHRNDGLILTAALEAPDHSLYTVGTIYHSLPTEPITTIKSIHVEHYSASGELLEKHIYGLDSLSVSTHCVIQRKDGSLVLGGEVTDSYNSFEPSTPLLLALDAQFHPLWNNYISFYDFTEGIRQLIELNDGRLLSCTTTDPLFSSLSVGDPSHILTFNKDGKIETITTIPCGNKNLRKIFLVQQNDNFYHGLGLIDDSERVTYDLSIFTIDSALQGCSTIITRRDSTIPLQISETLEPQLLLHTFTAMPLQRNIIFSPFKIDSNILICLDTGLSVTPLSNEMSLPVIVYPNPAEINKEVTIELPRALESSYKVVLKDMSGRTVYSIKNEMISDNKRKLTIPLHGLTSGAYIIEITDATFHRSLWEEKFIVK